jgi:hypothetical protein
LGVIASAILMRLPSEVRIPVVGFLVLVFLALAAGIFRRGARLIRWWRDEARDAEMRKRVAVVAEVVLPGAGCLARGDAWRGLPRLVLAAALLFVVLVFGLFGLPIYLFVSLGSALSLTEERSAPIPPPPTDDEPNLACPPAKPGTPGLPRKPTPAVVPADIDDEDW